MLAVTAFVAGLARGFSGFGAALIFVPLAASLIGPQKAAPLLLITDAFVTAPMVYASWSMARKSEVGLMAMGGLVGIPLGTYVLTVGDPLMLRWFIVALVAAMLGLLVSGWRYSGRPHDSLTVGVGTLSGVFSGVAQIGGPPVVAYWLGGNHEPREMRASTILYFAFGSAVSIATYLIGQLLSLDILALAVLLVPAFGIGLWIGSHVFHLASAATFRRICLALIALSLVLSLPVWR